MKLLAVVLGVSVVPAFCHEEGLELLRTRASVMSAVSEIFTDLTDDGLRPTDVSFSQIALERLNRLKQNLSSDQGFWIEPEVIVGEWAEAGRALTTLSDFMRYTGEGDNDLSLLDRQIGRWLEGVEDFRSRASDVVVSSLPLFQTRTIVEAIRDCLEVYPTDEENAVRNITFFAEKRDKLLQEWSSGSMMPFQLLGSWFRLHDLRLRTLGASAMILDVLMAFENQFMEELECVDAFWRYLKAQKKVLLDSFENDGITIYHRLDARDQLVENLDVSNHCDAEQISLNTPKLVEGYLRFYDVLGSRMSLLGFLRT